jgi:Na+/proline symporter
MSDIGILNDPLSLALIALLFASPGLPVGAIAGALLWRRHRILGALIGAVLGAVLCLVGLMWWKDLI